MTSQYSSVFSTEIRDVVNECKSVLNGLSPASTPVPSVAVSRSSHLPEIPLPSFEGNLPEWPVFRDRFVAFVVNRPELSNIERFYYLLGCLKGEALNTIKNISVSDVTYNLAWSTLVERFDKPRQLAFNIVDKLLAAPVHTQESLEGLKSFLSLFSDNVSTLITVIHS